MGRRSVPRKGFGRDSGIIVKGATPGLTILTATIHAIVIIHAGRHHRVIGLPCIASFTLVDYQVAQSKVSVAMKRECQAFSSNVHDINTKYSHAI